MKPALLEDYRNPTYRALARSVLTSITLQNKRIPFTAVMDASILHFKPWTQIVFNPKIRGGWKEVLEAYYESDEYKALNESVAGDPLLSKYATIHFLNKLFERARYELPRLKKPTNKDYDNPIDAAFDKLDDPAIPSDVRSSVIRSIVDSLKSEAEEIRKDIEAIESFSHLGVPVANLLEKPDDFREKARNRIVVNLVKFLQKLRREAPSLKQAKNPTIIGGRPLGVKKLQRWGELSRVLPMELIDDDLFSYRVASRSLRVSEQYGSVQNYVVYLDKSGSMSESIAYRESSVDISYVPKISFAAASALALAHKLKQVGAKMTLKLFDVEVHDPIQDFEKLLDTLMRIRADSGTNLTKVLEDAVEHHRDERIVVVTDGIDEIEPEAVRRAKSANLDLTCIFIKTDNRLLREHFPCVRLEEAKPDILLRI